MNPKTYIDELESLNEDIEPGFLADLRMDAPDKLHLSVMSEIRNEKKKKFYMNFRIYMPVAAAVLIITMFINGGNNYFTQLYAEKPVKNAVITPNAESTVTPEITPAAKNTDKTDIIKTPVDESTKAAVSSGKIAVNDIKTASQTPKPSTAVQNNTNVAKSTDGKTVAMNTDITSKDIAAITEDDSNLQNTEKDSGINLEITANSQSEVISFLKSYGTLVDDGKTKLYKLSMSYLDQLNTILAAGAAEGRLINGKISENEFVIRLVING